MKNLIDETVKNLLFKTLAQIEEITNSDVLNYYGAILDGYENQFLSIIEDLANDSNKKDCLAIILTTNGGSAMAVERYVNIIRKHYSKVIFIVPDYAYSAGTIFCMSGDDIYMDYFSVLGPIDPQVRNKEGKYVPALGYLDKVNNMLEKAKNGTLTTAEFMILKEMDLAELRAFEQAKELTISLLKKWLVKYKFKDWNIHETKRTPVSEDEKKMRAEEIAAKLGDNNLWKSHARPINIDDLEEMKLKINDYSNNTPLRNIIREYYDMVREFTIKYNINLFIHTRKFL